MITVMIAFMIGGLVVIPIIENVTGGLTGQVATILQYSSLMVGVVLFVLIVAMIRT